MVIMKGGGIRRGFSSTPYIRYRGKIQEGGEYTLVSFGRCNFRCGFCFTCGDEADDTGNFPDANEVPLDHIKDVVAEEVDKGRAIRLSGGEVGLYPEATMELLELVEEKDGFSIVDSNLTNYPVIKEFSGRADLLSVDPIKADEEHVEMVTGKPKELTWYRGIENTKRLDEMECPVEFKTMLFRYADGQTGPMDPEHLDFIHDTIPWNHPEGISWTLKRYLPMKHYWPEDNTQPMIPGEFDNGLVSPEPTECVDAADGLVERHPELEGRLMAITGSNRDPEAYEIY